VSWGFALWNALGFVLAAVAVEFGRLALIDHTLTKRLRYLWALGLWTFGVAAGLKVLARVIEVLP